MAAELREEIRKAQARKKSGAAPGVASDQPAAAPVKPAPRLPAPQDPATRRHGGGRPTADSTPGADSASKKGGTSGGAPPDPARRGEPKESRPDRIARLAERAAALGPAAGRDGHLIYGRAAKSGEQISAQLNFVSQDPIGRHEIWLTADVSGRLHISDKGKTFEISGASEAVTADGRQVTGRWWQSMNPLRFK